MINKQNNLTKESYQVFIKLYLEKFRKYYKSKETNKRELKRAVFDNKKLSERQKVDFWEKVVE